MANKRTPQGVDLAQRLHHHFRQSIPGYEKLVGRVINELMKLGAKWPMKKSMGFMFPATPPRTISRLIIGLTRPKFFVPVQGNTSI